MQLYNPQSARTTSHYNSAPALISQTQSMVTIDCAQSGNNNHHHLLDILFFDLSPIGNPFHLKYLHIPQTECHQSTRKQYFSHISICWHQVCPFNFCDPHLKMCWTLQKLHNPSHPCNSLFWLHEKASKLNDFFFHHLFIIIICYGIP